MTWLCISGTNNLLNVADVVNDPNILLGDFKYSTATKTAVKVDYKYDDNDHMISDNNKKITGIIYNILNLLSQITIAGNWIIKYFYDVAGNKLQKWIRGNTVSTGKT